jgi:hypothetical protein
LSNNAAINAPVLNVGPNPMPTPTAGFPPTGRLRVSASGGVAVLNYMGTTATSFTGVTVGIGNPAWTLTTGNQVAGLPAQTCLAPQFHRTRAAATTFRTRVYTGAHDGITACQAGAPCLISVELVSAQDIDPTSVTFARINFRS